MSNPVDDLPLLGFCWLANMPTESGEITRTVPDSKGNCVLIVRLPIDHWLADTGELKQVLDAAIAKGKR